MQNHVLNNYFMYVAEVRNWCFMEDRILPYVCCRHVSILLVYFLLSLFMIYNF